MLAVAFTPGGGVAHLQLGAVCALRRRAQLRCSEATCVTLHLVQAGCQPSLGRFAAVSSHSNVTSLFATGLRMRDDAALAQDIHCYRIVGSNVCISRAH